MLTTESTRQGILVTPIMFARSSSTVLMTESTKLLQVIPFLGPLETLSPHVVAVVDCTLEQLIETGRLGNTPPSECVSVGVVVLMVIGIMWLLLLSSYLTTPNSCECGGHLK